MKTAAAALFLLWFAGCGGGSEDLALDEIDLEVKVLRLDVDMANAARSLQADSTVDTLVLYQEHFAGYRNFITEWMFLGQDSGVTDAMVAGMMYRFVADSYGQDLLDTIQQALPSGSFDPSAALTPLFKRYRYYFPDRSIPEIVTFVDGYPPTAQAGFDQLVVTPTYLGIGVHYLMGGKFPYYPPDLPKYVRRRFNPAHLPALVAHRLADIAVPAPALDENPVLLDYIIQEGLQMHFVDKVLGPDISDTIKMYYTAEQLEWAQFYEGKAYLDLLPHLYEIDYEQVRRYVEDSPFTSQLNRKSAPRLGQFLGWKIVQAYAEKHPEEQLAGLVARTDYAQIYKAAGYRPPRNE